MVRISSLTHRLVETIGFFRPMSHISAIFGTDEDEEILTSLYLIVNVSCARQDNRCGLKRMQNTQGLGLIHESQSIKDSSYTRSWFGWANSYFAEMILDLAGRKPGLILKSNESYVVGQCHSSQI